MSSCHPPRRRRPNKENERVAFPANSTTHRVDPAAAGERRRHDGRDGMRRYHRYERPTLQEGLSVRQRVHQLQRCLPQGCAVRHQWDCPGFAAAVSGKRPLLFDIDASLAPARMTLCFPGRPNRFITVRIRRDVHSLHEARIAAIAELEAFTPEQLLMLGECSAPAPVAPDPAAPTVMIEQLEQEDRYAGPLYCPACCARLGRGDSPAVGYLERCPRCKRRLMIKFTPGAVAIVLWPAGG